MSNEPAQVEGARVGEKASGTKALIDDAKEASDIKSDADAAMATAAQAATDATNSLADKNKLVHDDLEANGSALYIEGESYFIATAADPAGYTLTPIRIA